jgi:archaellum component FlaC
MQPLDQQPQQDQGQNPRNGTGSVDPEVEELIETIVAENFQRVNAEFENVYEELDALGEKLENLDNRVHDLEIRDDEDQEQFVQKVEEMEDHIDNYQSRIGGLEKAFQQVLPNLVDNVRDLTQLVQEIKQEKGIETKTNVSQQEMQDMDDELKDW